jgi:hypothetical protein
VTGTDHSVQKFLFERALRETSYNLQGLICCNHDDDDDDLMVCILLPYIAIIDYHPFEANEVIPNTLKYKQMVETHGMLAAHFQCERKKLNSIAKNEQKFSSDYI